MKPCAYCKKDFEPKMPKQVYCGASCSARAHSIKYSAWRKVNPAKKKEPNCVCPKCSAFYYRAGKHDGRIFCNPCIYTIEVCELADTMAAEHPVNIGRVW